MKSADEIGSQNRLGLLFTHLCQLAIDAYFTILRLYKCLMYNQVKPQEEEEEEEKVLS